jgi:transcription-repair coupling factor (superfamily II helicase)
VVHGKMPAADIDEVMIAFADGEGDVLLATNIIESGLDLPRANTMLVWRPDRFGVAQLHQLRGRVGRGRRRGLAYLLTDPAGKIAAATDKRLRILTDLDRLGAGFAISRRDMDMRGAGDLLGEAQAGHVRLIGIELYRDLLDRALAHAKGGSAAEEHAVDLNLDVMGLIPADYVSDPEIRINLYARLGRLCDERQIDDFAEEIDDRFGPFPPGVATLLDLARLRVMARRFGIVRVDAGPRAIAMTFEPAAAQRWRKLIVRAGDKARLDWKEERLVSDQLSEAGNRIAALFQLFEELEELL